MQLTKFQQENVLALLIWSDKYCSLIRGSVDLDLFDQPYKNIAEKSYYFIDKFKTAPKDQIADELEIYLSKIESSERYKETLLSLFSIKDKVLDESFNSEYILSKLTDFIVTKKFQDAILDAADLTTKGKLNDAVELIRKASNFNLSLFDPGIKITDLDSLFNSLEDIDVFPSGVQALDMMGVGPARKQMIMYIGNPSSGKSMWLMNMGKNTALNTNKVVHITLEVYQNDIQQRYIQSILGLTKWSIQGILKSPIFVRDDFGKILKVQQIPINVKSFDDSDIRDYISNSKTFKHLKSLIENVRIKWFPPNSLSITKLNAYLDGLEQTEGFIPDLVIIDMLQYMKLTKDKDYRIRFGGLLSDIRGLAGERNIAIASAHQINREGFKSKGKASMEHISENWDIAGISDTGIMHNQTKMEEQSKLFRLDVIRARTMQSKFSVLVASNFDICQFSLNSVVLPSYYDHTAATFLSKVNIDNSSKLVLSPENNAI